jgi:hypothetical protein
MARKSCSRSSRLVSPASSHCRSGCAGSRGGGKCSMGGGGAQIAAAGCGSGCEGLQQITSFIALQFRVCKGPCVWHRTHAGFEGGARNVNEDPAGSLSAQCGAAVLWHSLSMQPPTLFGYWHTAPLSAAVDTAPGLLCAPLLFL